MTIEHFAGVLLVLYGLGLASLCWSFLQTVRLVQMPGPTLPRDVPLADWPTLDVAIPVKDEEERIAECVQSILAQGYPRLNQVIVANDRSADGTAAAVEAVQERDGRVQRVDIRELPPGLYGKPHALSRVGSKLTADTLAFIDSDFTLRPNCLQTLVHHLQMQRLDWLAVMGAPELTGFWERLLIPLLGAVSYAWYDPRKISDPQSPTAIGSGFIVVRREAYEAIGGHGAVVRAYDEDSALMRFAKGAGHRIAYVLTPELFTLKFYGTLRGTLHGMKRTFIGGIKTIPRMLLNICGINFVSLFPFEVMFLILIAPWIGWAIPYRAVWSALCGIHILVGLALAWVINSRARGVRRYALLHPLGSVMLLIVCFRAMREMARGTGVTWRGTTY